MKKLLLLMVLISSIGVFAQNTRRVYCELLGTGKVMSTKLGITVDFGQSTSFWTGYSKQYLVDENGDAIKFNSMVDAMNFMGKLDWKFEQAYVVSVSNQNVIHWLLSKDITDDSELNKGINTKESYLKENEKD